MDAVCTVKEPSNCTADELQDFAAFVLAGGEVSPAGLLGRITAAYSLAFLRVGTCLVGVAGLKVPSANHRHEVSVGASVEIPENDFPLELGWVFVLPSARGKKSFSLCNPLIVTAGSKGIIATSRSENGAMHTTLGKLGFSRMGEEWPSRQSTDKLWLFAKQAV